MLQSYGKGPKLSRGLHRPSAYFLIVNKTLQRKSQFVMSQDPAQHWYVYIVEASNGQLYTGITKDVQRRFDEHQQVHDGVSSKGAKFFRTTAPKALVYVQSWPDRSQATKREIEIKKMTRRQKLRLIASVT